MFHKYIHLERFGTDAVDGITNGICHIFPKLDGTNASFWFDTEDNQFHCGSRNRELSLSEDNAGFMNWAVNQVKLKELAKAYPNYRFFGEWLVPHTVKTYRGDAWRNLYIFDVMAPDGEFLDYLTYTQILDGYGVSYIPRMAMWCDPTYADLLKTLAENTYLLQEGQTGGEGIVIKQYGWKNRFKHTTWAKLIANTFKEDFHKAKGTEEAPPQLLEETIAEEFITPHVVEKVVAKIRNEKGSFEAKDIPRLLNTTYHELVTEEMWEIVKKHKNPKIDFRTLNTCAIKQVKRLMPALFGAAA